MKKRLKRTLRWLAGIVAVMVLMFLGLIGLLYLEAFTRFAANTASSLVTGLEIRDVQGSVGGGVGFAAVYQTDALNVEAVDARLHVATACLWRAALCVELLSVKELYVQLPPQSETEPPSEDSPAPIELPEIQLPIDVSVDEINIARTEVRQGEQSLYRLDDFFVHFTWTDYRLQIGQLEGTDPYCHWQLAGDVELVDDYPLNMEVDCASQNDWGRLRAELTGTAAELDTRILADTRALPAQQTVSLIAKVFIQPLDPERPLEARVELQQPVQINRGELQLTLSAAQIDLSGPLLQPRFTVVAVAQTNQWDGDNRLEMLARANTQQLVVEQLDLLLPRGEVHAQGRLAYAEAIAWDGQLNWQDLDGQLWRDDLDVQLSGAATQTVALRGGDLQASVKLQNLDGSLYDKPLQGSGQFDYQNGQVAINELQLQQGENQLNADGALAANAEQQLQIRYNAPQLASLWPPLAGASNGTVQLGGSLEQLAVDADIQASEVSYGDIRVDSATLNATWHRDLASDNQIQLTATRIVAGAAPPARVELNWNGTLADHSLSFDLQGMDEQAGRGVALACSGGFVDSKTSVNVERWSGACERLTLDFLIADAPQHWENDDAIEIDIEPLAASVNVSPFCLRNAPARVCSAQPLRYENNELANVQMRGRDIPIVWLQPWLPEGTELEGDWQFDLRASGLAQNPNLEMDVTSDQLLARWQNKQGEDKQLHVTQTRFNWRWQDQQQRLNWDIDTAQNGNIQGQLEIAGAAAQQQNLNGELSINQLQLLAFSHLIVTDAADSFSGEVNGRLRVDGTLTQPQLHGNVELTDGRVVAGVLPVPVRDIRLRADIDRNLALLDGSFLAAEGEGSIGGEFNWREMPWSGTLTLEADQLVLKPEPNIQVTLAPDVELAVTPETLALSGQVQVPSAQVKIEELPAQAVSVSSDARVVGGEPTVETDTGLQVQSDLKLVLGDEVYFEGFGLETRIAGSLNIRQTGSELVKADGILQLREGRYKAYGQNLKITNGDLIFVNNLQNPQLRVEAIRANTSNNVTVGLRARGSARNPRIELFSDPSMPEQEQLSYLLTGNPPGTETEIDPQQTAARAALSFALESETGTSVTRRAGEALGIEDLQVTTDAGDDGTQIGLSGYISPNLMVSYGVGVFDAVNSLTLQYKLTTNIYLEAVSGEASSLELLWSFEKD